MKKTRIYLVDDEPVVLRGLQLLLDRQPGMEIVGFADSDADALGQAASLRPDIIVLDLTLRDGDGFRMISAFRASCPRARLLFFFHACRARVHRGGHSGGGGRLRGEGGRDGKIAVGGRAIDPVLPARLGGDDPFGSAGRNRRRSHAATDLQRMRALQKWTVVLALLVSIATPWTVLQSAAWFGMLIRYSQSASLSKAIEMTFDGQHPCRLCKIVRQCQQEDYEQKPITRCSDKKFQLALPPVAKVSFYPPPSHQVYPLPLFPGPRPLRPPSPPPRCA